MNRPVYLLYRSRIGTWVIRPTCEPSTRCELHWYPLVGESERCGVYHDPGHAAGAVQSQTTGLDGWDAMAVLPADIGNLSAWERVENYP